MFYKFKVPGLNLCKNIDYSVEVTVIFLSASRQIPGDLN